MADDRNEPSTGIARNRHKIDISLLQTFHLVARTGSFSAASRELNISYQSAANHVRRLEQIYGARLIEAEKGARQITLTPQGRALHVSLGDEMETILSRLSVLMHDVHSVLRVGVPQALFHQFFPDILRSFRAEEPEIELAFFEHDTTLEKMMMGGGALDAAISERSFSHPAISQRLIGTYRLALVYPQDWAPPPRGPVTNAPDLTVFRDRPFVTYETGQIVRSRAVDFMTRAMQAPPAHRHLCLGVHQRDQADQGRAWLRHLAGMERRPRRERRRQDHSRGYGADDTLVREFGLSWNEQVHPALASILPDGFCRRSGSESGRITGVTAPSKALPLPPARTPRPAAPGRSPPIPQPASRSSGFR